MQQTLTLGLLREIAADFLDGVPLWRYIETDGAGRLHKEALTSVFLMQTAVIIAPDIEASQIPEGMYAWPVNRDITAYMTVPRDSRGPMANEGMQTLPLARKIRGVFRFRYRHKSPHVVQVQF